VASVLAVFRQTMHQPQQGIDRVEQGRLHGFGQGIPDTRRGVIGGITGGKGEMV
jgi:hypothetical protein